MSGMDDALRRDATDQADLVRRGEISARELVSAAIDRVEALRFPPEAPLSAL